MSQEFPKLFSPIKIGPMEVKNRIALAPMANYMSDATGVMTPAQVDFMEARAKGGTGLVLMGSVYVQHPHARFGIGQCGLYEDSMIPAYKEMVDRVKAHGDGHRHGLVDAKILFIGQDISVFAGCGMQGKAVSVNDHRPIRAEIDPPIVRVSLDDGMGRTEIPIAVQFVEPGHRKLQKIDLISRESILQDRTGADKLGRNRTKALRFLIPVLRNGQTVYPVFRQPKGLGNPPG